MHSDINKQRRKCANIEKRSHIQFLASLLSYMYMRTMRKLSLIITAWNNLP